MSKKNNVNPDFYKIGGRGRPPEIAPVREQAARSGGKPVSRGEKKRS